MKRFIHLWENTSLNGVTTISLKTKEGIEVFEYDWYFCVKFSDLTSEIKRELQEMKKAKKIKKFVKQGEWLKIYTHYFKRDNPIVKYVQSLIPTYEGDLKLWMRYLVDEDIELDTDQRILYFDIETDDTKPGITPGAEQITCIGAVGSDGERYQYFSVTDEKSILKKFVKLVDQYDLLTGWNSEGFDLVAIAKRCKLFGIKFGCWATEWSTKDMGGLDNVRKSGKYRARPETFNHIDMMMKIKEMHYRDTELIKKVRSFSLEAVAQAMIGEGKLDRDKEHVSTYKLARENPEFFKKYNMQDVDLLVKLDKKLNIIQQKLIEHHVCNARVNDYTSHGKIDPYALRAARKMGQHFPTRPDKPETDFKDIDPGISEDSERGVKTKGDYIGGFVFEPVKGLHNDVYVFDYQSLYPSIIKTFNVSLDSYLGQLKKGYKTKQIVMPSGAKFQKDRVGIIPAIIQTVLDERNRIRFVDMKTVVKDSPEYWNMHYKQYSFKVLANSMYGIMGASFSRYFNRDLAEGITLTGQYLIKFSWDWMVKRGHTPIYGDSDSLFVKLAFKEDIKDLVLKLKEALDTDLQKFNINKSHMQMDFEKVYEKFILVAKKKYIGKAADGDMKITGLELKKRDTLPMAEDLQRKVLNLLLDDPKPRRQIIDIVTDLKEQVEKGKMTKKDLTYQKRLSREITGYGKQMKDKNGDVKLKKDGTERTVPIPIWVKVAMELKKRIDEGGKGMDKTISYYSAGNYIPFIITDSGKDGIKAIWAEDFDGEYDIPYYWNAIFAPTERVLEVVYPKYDWKSI